MKIFQLLVASLLITLCNTHAQHSTTKTDLEKINTFGKVKSIKGFVLGVDENESSKNLQVALMFNEKGNREEVHWYDHIGNVSSKDFYTYDSVKNTIVMKRYQLDTILKMKSITTLNTQ